MHEFAIAQDIISSLEKSLGNDFKKINKINIGIGSFSGIVTDSLSFGLETLFKTENITSEVEINITERETIAECECGNKYKIKGIFDFCPVCNSPVRKISGEMTEIYVDSVEIEKEN